MQAPDAVFAAAGISLGVNAKVAGVVMMAPNLSVTLMAPVGPPQTCQQPRTPDGPVIAETIERAAQAAQQPE